MMPQRKNAEVRKKELKLAIFRIEQGRSKTKSKELNISSVAREAGVSPALIHNYYPSIAEEIRVKQGASSRQQRDKKQNELTHEREKNASLRSELEEVKIRLIKLVTVNEMLIVENQRLKSKQDIGNVIDISRVPQRHG
jgi:AcrR family transcriptional regulator